MGKRIVAIDILKVFAVLVVLNSHMELSYGEWDILATGGAIGDALFFFCSGFMLFRGRQQRFDNFMKRRISRIYPTILIVSIVGAALFNNNDNIIDIILSGGGWFVSCIMLYYVVLWFIKRHCLKSLTYVWLALLIIIVTVYYLAFDHADTISLYGANYFKWVFFFASMLQGAQMGLSPEKYRYNNWVIPKLLACIICWYCFFLFQNKLHIFVDIQYVSIIFLLGITYYFYKFCNAPFWIKLYENKFAGNIIFIVGGLCLECYLIQGYFITDRLNMLFPFNIPIIMTFILMVSYIVNFGASALGATFRKEDYNWKDYLLYKK